MPSITSMTFEISPEESRICWIDSVRWFISVTPRSTSERVSFASPFASRTLLVFCSVSWAMPSIEPSMAWIDAASSEALRER